MSPADMNHRSQMLTRRHDAHISDAARLANELQREFPECSRTAALLEAERLQALHGLGLTLSHPVLPGRPPTTGRYDTREELERMVRAFAARQSVRDVARVCRVSHSVVRSILTKGLP